MSRLIRYLGLMFALALGTLLVAVFAPDAPASAPVPQVATTTVALEVASSSRPAPTSPASETATTMEAASDKKAPVPTMAAKPVAEAPVPTTVNIPPPTNAELDASATLLRSALVNIMCYATAGTGLHGISGSGVFVDSKGIIITNAHIAQYFLLANRKVSCTIRTGGPAIDTYKAALIYLSPSWIRDNPTVLTQTAAAGTGQYDFAFLAVTKSATSMALPASFPAIPLSKASPIAGMPVVIASYGAQFLEASQIRSDLSPIIVFGSIKDIFTFVAKTVDVIVLGGSAAAQEGSSGGGVADGYGSLAGLITTSSIEGSTDTRSLAGISATYVRAEYERETGSSLDTLLSQPTTSSIADFAPQMPALEAIITANLP